MSYAVKESLPRSLEFLVSETYRWFSRYLFILLLLMLNILTNNDSDLLGGFVQHIVFQVMYLYFSTRISNFRSKQGVAILTPGRNPAVTLTFFGFIFFLGPQIVSISIG